MKKKMINPASAFTLVEVLIVVSIIAIIAGIVMAASIKSTYQKARDSKRKMDLNKMVRVLEDYYAEYGHYPPGNDPPDGRIAGASWGKSFPPFAPNLPKDPLSPNQDYYYQTGPNQNFYVIYAKLENTSDDDIVRVGCSEGCGPTNEQGKRVFNYLVTSTNLHLIAGVPEGYDPGQLPSAGGGEDEGGGIQPTSTPIPTITLAPSPTPEFNPNPPTGGELCAHNQCCKINWCGAYTIEEGGSFCVSREKCMYDPFFGSWGCASEPACP